MTFIEDFAFCEPADPAEAARLERVTIIAWALSDGPADLDDFESVVRALYARGFTSADFMPVLDDSVEIAREARGGTINIFPAVNDGDFQGPGNRKRRLESD
jgi:hypothetical protein